MDDFKYLFIKKVEQPDYKNLVNSAVKQGSFSYNQMVVIPSLIHSTGYSSMEDVEKLAEAIYKNWYALMKLHLNSMTPEYEKEKPESAEFIKKITSNSSFEIENVSKTGFYKKLQYIAGYSFEDDWGYKCPFPPIIQDHFFHVKSHYFRGGQGIGSKDIECRLYLNLKAKNIPDFCRAFSKKCLEQQLPFYYKTAFTDSRIDGVVIYTKYKDEHVQKCVSILEDLKIEYPQIFEGAEKVSPYLGKIGDFIGFGEEPIIKHDSFNNIRSEAIEEIVKLSNKKIAEKVNELLNDGQTIIRNSYGKDLSPKDYFYYLIKKEGIVGLEKEIEKSNNLLNQDPEKNRLYCLKQINNYNQIILELRKESDYGKKIIEDTTKKIFGSISKGELPKRIELVTKDKDIYLTNFNLNEKIRDVFKVDLEKTARQFVTDDLIKSVFEKYDISYELPHLNLTTAKQLQIHGARQTF